MAEQSLFDILQQGGKAWNLWREEWRLENPWGSPYLAEADLPKADLSEADLSRAILHSAKLSEAKLSEAKLSEADLSYANLPGANLSYANLSGAKLFKANLSGAKLSRAELTGEVRLNEADLSGADLSYAKLSEAKLSYANLSGANLSGADLRSANLYGADLTRADLTRADLIGAILFTADLTEADLTDADLSYCTIVEADFKGATITGCSIYAVSAWDLKLEGAIQHNLNISPPDEPVITVDDLEVAQFIHLLINNKKIRDVINTITSKVVLILGRFTPERKAVLDAIRDALRKHDYMPVLFDFDKPSSRGLTETVFTLAGMARFIIADLTDPRSIPQELEAVVPHFRHVPVQPILLASEDDYGMFEDFKGLAWVLETYRYDDADQLIATLEDNVISPAEAKATELSS